MKKTLSLILALALMLGLVGSLSFSSAEEKEYKYSYTVTPYDTGTPYNDPSTTDEDLSLYTAIFDKYDIYLDFVFVEDKATQFPLLAASGELPDAIYNGAWSQAFLEQGIIGTWDEEWYRGVSPKISAYVDEYAPEAWALTKMGDEMYMLPGVNAQYMYPDVIAWNMTWLKALGYEEIPEDLEEVEKIFYDIAKKDPDGNGKDDTYALSAEGMRALYGAFGFQRGIWVEDGETGDVVFGDVMPKAKDALTYLAKWYADGVLDPEFVTGENEGGYKYTTHAFIKGRIGMTNMGRWYHWSQLPEVGYYVVNTKEVQALENPFEVGFSKPIKGPYGDQKILCRGGADSRFNFNIDLVEDTEKFTYLLQFIDEIACDQEAYTWQWFGIEGEDFDYVEYGDLRVPTRYPIDADDTRTPVHQLMANAFNFNVSHPDLQKFATQLGFTFVDQLEGEWYREVSLVDAVKESLPSAVDYKTECDKILAEGYIAIITGEKDIDYFDEMVDAWYKAGGEILTKEANEIYHSK